MSRNKKIIFGICFVAFLVVLWLVVYKFWLSVEPKGDNFITSEQLVEMDKGSSKSDARVFIGSKEYSLHDLSKENLQGVVIVDVEIDSDKIQGYVVFDKNVSEPTIQYKENDSYAKVILPDKVVDKNE